MNLQLWIPDPCSNLPLKQDMLSKLVPSGATSSMVGNILVFVVPVCACALCALCACVLCVCVLCALCVLCVCFVCVLCVCVCVSECESERERERERERGEREKRRISVCFSLRKRGVTVDLCSPCQWMV